MDQVGIPEETETIKVFVLLFQHPTNARFSRVKITGPNGSRTFSANANSLRETIPKIGKITIGTTGAFILRMALLGRCPSNFSRGTPAEWCKAGYMFFNRIGSDAGLATLVDLGCLHAEGKAYRRIYEWPRNIEFVLTDERPKPLP